MKKVIILISTAILFFLLVSFAQAQDASLFILPQSESFEVGDTFSAELPEYGRYFYQFRQSRYLFSI